MRRSRPRYPVPGATSSWFVRQTRSRILRVRDGDLLPDGDLVGIRRQLGIGVADGVPLHLVAVEVLRDLPQVVARLHGVRLTARRAVAAGLHLEIVRDLRVGRLAERL